MVLDFQPANVGKRVQQMRAAGGKIELGHHLINGASNDALSLAMSHKLSWIMSCSDGLATGLGRRILGAREDGAEGMSMNAGNGTAGLSGPAPE
jgi:hypothetical protein